MPEMIVHGEIPRMLYASSSPKPLDRIPDESVSVLSIAKVGSMSVFRSLAASGIPCGKFHHGEDWLRRRQLGAPVYRIIDCVRDPMAVAVSVMFQLVCAPPDEVGQHRLCSTTEIGERHRSDPDGLRRDLLAHFEQQGFLDRVEGWFGRHLGFVADQLDVDLLGNFESARPFVELRGATTDQEPVHYLLCKCEHLDELGPTIARFVDNDQFAYTRHHRTSDKPILGEVYRFYLSRLEVDRADLAAYYRRSTLCRFYTEEELMRFLGSWTSQTGVGLV